MAGLASCAEAAVLATIRAIGLTAAARCQRDVLLVMFLLSPFGPEKPAQTCKGALNPSPDTRDIRVLRKRNGCCSYTYVFKALRIHFDDAEAADLVRHRSAG